MSKVMHVAVLQKLLSFSGQTVTRLLSGKLSLDNVSERKDEMRLGMTLTANPKDGSFVVSPTTQKSTTQNAASGRDGRHLKASRNI